jgi:multiple sugar transport system substrate-binding protein
LVVARRLALVGSLLVTSFLWACNPAAQDQEGEAAGPVETVAPEDLEGTIQVWGFGTEDPIGKTRIEEFERQYPNVKVRLTPGDFDEQKFLSAVAAGDPPDVVHIDRNQIGSYANRGALLPIDDYIDSSGLDTGVFYEVAFDQVQYDGQTYGLPEFNNTIIAILNNKALEDSGLSPDDVDFSDWDSLAQVNRQLSKMQGDDVARVGFDPKMPEFLPLWAAANGSGILNEDGTESLLDSPEVVEAVEYAAGLYDAYGGRSKYAAFSQSWDIFGDQNPLVADQVGITLFEQWYLSILGEVSPDVDITVKPFTTHDGGEEISYVAGLAWAVPQGASNPQAAFEFMRFMTEEETWVTAAQAAKAEADKQRGVYLGTYTANRPADERIFAEVYEPAANEALHEGVQLVLELQETAVSMPPNAAGAEVLQAYTEAVEKALLGEVGAQQALEEADQEAQSALDQAAQ